jgi:hypothetical protein
MPTLPDRIRDLLATNAGMTDMQITKALELRSGQ